MRSLTAAVAALLLACGESTAPVDPDALPPTARPEVLETLRADAEAERSPADGGGRAWLEAGPDGPPRARVGFPGRFPIVYEAGPLGVAEGGQVFLQVSPFWGWSTPQVVEPEAPGYTTVSSEAAGVELWPATLDQQLLAVEVRGRALAPGEQVRFDYGAGAAGARVDRFAESDARFWIAVDGDGDGTRAFIEKSPGVDVAPGPAARLVLLLPPTARPGEAVALSAAVLDREGNAGVAYEGELALESLAPGLVAPERLRFTAADAGHKRVSLRVDAPGVYRLRARGPDGLEAESNPLRVSAAGPRLLWADLHGHSALSDGTGTPEDYYRYARDVAALDVAALTDHDHWGLPFLDESPELWREITATTRRFHEPGRFVALLGYEWTSWIQGHRHVLHFEDSAEIRSSFDPDYDEPTELWAALRGSPALTLAHHSAGGPVATNWAVPPDPELEPVTEIVSVHGSSEAADTPLPIYSPVPGNFVRDVLARGYRLGFVGSGDSHDGHPGLAQLASPSGGLAGVFAEERTRESVLEALRARRVYATNGPRIVLLASLGGRPMGASVPPGDRLLRVEVAAPGALERIDLIRGEGVVASRPLEGVREAFLELALEGLRSGEALYVRVVQTDEGAAWSSPFFIDADPER